ncbi:MAG: hypothetical protein ACJ76H_13395 [Bacteriovoracaceae bacterium]
MRKLISALALISIIAGCSSAHKKKEPVDEHIKQQQQEEQMRTGDIHKSDVYGPGFDYGRASPTI